MAFCTKEELTAMNFAEIGNNVLISTKCSIYNPTKISIGSDVRIDDFCIISAGEMGIKIGCNVHIACYVSLIGKELIDIGNFVGISSKTAIYSSSDDYSGDYLTGPTVQEKFRNVDHRAVVLEDHVIIGAQSIILPGVTIKTGSAIGSLSLVTKNVDSWGIYAGVPLKFIKIRSKKMLDNICK